MGFRVRLVGGVEKWEDGKLVGGWKISWRMEKWEDRRDLVFLVCLVGGVENWEGGKLFCLVGEKRRGWKM